MSEPLSAAKALAALRAEGCRVEEYRSWRTHNRGNRGTGWGPVNGVMIHHTVTSGTAATVRICYDGYAALPGPLCHGVIGKNGVVYLVGWGRANHAGLGDDNVLDAVIREDGSLPAANERNTDGNSRFYGFECENLGDGRDPWPDAQLDCIERAVAALCRAHGWTADSMIAHKEWSYTKIDPRGFSIEGMRRRIADRLDQGPQEDDVTRDEMEEIAELAAKKTYAMLRDEDGWPVPAGWGGPGNSTWKLPSVSTYLGDQQERIEVGVRELSARGAARDAVLAHLATGGGLEGAELTAAAEAGADRALAKLGESLREQTGQEG